MSSVYKYLSLSKSNTGITDFLQKAFHKLKFTSPTSFNDPFDSKALFSIDSMDQNDWEAYIGARYRLLEVEDPRIPLNKRRQKIEEAIKPIIAKKPWHDSGWREEQEQTIKREATEIIASWGIVSLSLCCKDILMWSHYADSHRGICLQFDYDKLKDNYEEFREVKYTCDYPTYKEFIDGKTPYLDFVFKKSDHWKYEQELRIWRDCNGWDEIPASALTGIVFGCKVDAEIKKLIEDYLINEKLDIKRYQAKLSGSMFSIEIPGLTP